LFIEVVCWPHNFSLQIKLIFQQGYVDTICGDTNFSNQDMNIHDDLADTCKEVDLSTDQNVPKIF